jgi:hypothetical protein
MTTYRYVLTSNTPLAATVGLGNTPVVSPSRFYQGELGETSAARSNGASTADGYELKIVLVEVQP